MDLITSITSITSVTSITLMAVIIDCIFFHILVFFGFLIIVNNNTININANNFNAHEFDHNK
ncbi:hypothetical protein K502DRAFT_245036 [Neoconidiobolus thromboides FSU 785]|nr:hypothetical protein K502DRAFT_245036 [Neoconidiobolus thromboides FSU 785]